MNNVFKLPTLILLACVPLSSQAWWGPYGAAPYGTPYYGSNPYENMDENPNANADKNVDATMPAYGDTGAPWSGGYAPVYPPQYPVYAPPPWGGYGYGYAPPPAMVSPGNAYARPWGPDFIPDNDAAPNNSSDGMKAMLERSEAAYTKTMQALKARHAAFRARMEAKHAAMMARREAWLKNLPRYAPEPAAAASKPVIAATASKQQATGYPKAPSESAPIAKPNTTPAVEPNMAQ